jgi:hypothetical protein
MLTASLVCFLIGIADIVWAFWGDFTETNPSPSIASRFESGFIFLVVSFVLYLLARRSQVRKTI